MLNSISRACMQQAVHTGSLYENTTISVGTVLLLRERPKRINTLKIKDTEFWRQK